jgi:hypothetical protein
MIEASKGRLVRELAVLAALVIPGLQGCRSQEVPSAVPVRRDRQSDAATASPEAEYALPLAANPLRAEYPAFLSWNDGRYDAVPPGPVGARIIGEQKPEDMSLLRDALMQTDGIRTVRIGRELPLRHCDYALMIAERLPGQPSASSGEHSFNPFTPYERRDATRYDLLKRIFGVSPPKDVVKYTYLDEQGRDVSESYREAPDWP